MSTDSPQAGWLSRQIWGHTTQPSNMPMLANTTTRMSTVSSQMGSMSPSFQQLLPAPTRKRAMMPRVVNSRISLLSPPVVRPMASLAAR